MEPSTPLPRTPIGRLERRSSTSLASFQSKSLNRPSRASGLWFEELFMWCGIGDSARKIFQVLSIQYTEDGSRDLGLIEKSLGVPVDRISDNNTSLTPQTPSSFPLPLSDSELPFHPDIDELRLSLQTLSPRPVLQTLFKENKTACNLRFHPYLPTRQPCREFGPLLFAPVRALGCSVEEGTIHDYGTSITTSNPFAPTDKVTYSTSHHVPSSLENILHDLSSRPHAIPLEYLRKITNNFSDERILGKGGSGVVYKGLPQHGEIIAVKKIVSSLMPGLQKQFENEVSHLMELKHANIVQCVGYCYEIMKECLQYNGKYVFAEMAERLLCLEYMPNGSLDKYISDESSGLDWSTRYRIIEGICYGLCHLHEQNGKPIIHLDLKPANILLGDGMVPKITDFGLSRLLDRQNTVCTTSRDGTFGYMAPEFLHGGTITPKSDIFSLGVIIMEIVTGHRDYPDVTRTSLDEFIKLVHDKWKNVLQRSPGYESLETDCQQIERCIQVGLICVNPDRTKRPPIAKIINMIQGSESINCDTGIEAA